mgnify:CR=1 FL=1|tara:strand:+ start:6256 stop:6723 length:468 start_codon:yes stop_codon:yes gene_type:complete
MGSNYSEGRQCSICEHPITDNNPDGIGFQCRDIWYQARAKSFYHFYPFASWEKQLDIIIPTFIDLYKDIKFRSNFRKSFYSSICNIWETHKRISRKQRDICYSWIGDKLSDADNDEFYISVKKAEKIYKLWTPQTKEEREYLNDCVGKMYGKQNK